MDGYECQGFSFYSNFDSANLYRVEHVPKSNENDIPHTSLTGKTELVDNEFNLWTKPDCAGTEYENGNRTWFYFAVKAPMPLAYVKFNVIDINKQAKLYSQGMVPVYKIVPGKHSWERISDKPTYTVENAFSLSFKFRMPESVNSLVYLAFTYPYSFQDLQNKLDLFDRRYRKSEDIESLDDIYYVRESVCHTVEGRRVDLLTVSSFHGITDKRETALRNLFQEKSIPRPYIFTNKKVIFMSARVHPGETPSSFVLNGFLNLIMTRDDPIAQILRRLYVFKIIPCLNPDGVVNGHYRTDTRGVNLNRVYLNPSITEHPTIYAARSLIRYYHYGYERESDEMDFGAQDENILTEVSAITLEENNLRNQIWCNKCRGTKPGCDTPRPPNITALFCVNCGDNVLNTESELFLYLDMHGHASKKGIFMYGNHFDDLEANVRCMMLPKIMSLNNQNFHFTACNFTERNMYLKDKRDGMSREGSGRVAVYKLTGLIQSYTLECNYNTGRLVNHLPPCAKEGYRAMPTMIIPPKYTPIVFEEVGRALGVSILDLTGSNPFSRVAHSEYHSLNGLRDWLRIHYTYNLGEARKSPKKGKLRQTTSLHAQGKTVRPVLKTRSFPTKYHSKKTNLKHRQPKIAIKKRVEKEVEPQPSCSYDNQPPSSSSSSGGCHQRRQTRRKTMLVMHQTKSPPPMTLSTDRRAGINYVARNIRNTKPPLKKAEAPPKTERSSDVKVKEICYVKNATGKRMIATYERDNRVESENLIVAWNTPHARPQVFTHKPRIPPVVVGANKSPVNVGGGEPRQRNVRVHSFQKANIATYSKTKLTKRVLRTSTETPSRTSSKMSKRKKDMKTKKKKTRLAKTTTT